MKTLRLLSLCLVGGALTLSACGDKTDTESTGASTVATTSNGSADTDNDEDTGGPDDFGGDGDGDPGTTTTTSAGFVPTDGDMPSIAECDPWAQDCPEGEKCVAYGSTGGGWDANKCVPINGDGTQGEPCTYDGTAASTDDCNADTWCWNVSEEGVGVCTSFCTGSPDDPICEPGYGCSIANEGSITLCLLNCDPLLQDCPSATDSCFYDFSGNFVCAFFTQNLPTGEPCGFINDCIGGDICLGADVLPSCAGASCCAEFCDLTDPTCTVEGTECTPLFEDGTAPPDYVDVGVCIIPGA
ncbi:hypothetical protein [Enhygromyxa salina]|uniref:hypothetical protein n=1 Tax=Enhygromyxa salina TaxID=215803 RepID=UPI0004E720CE|nr:hypothetical protein [Enhygromyxa salina]